MKSLKTHYHKRLKTVLIAGFTLVEVTLAAGITAIGVTTVLGLVPHGLSNLREAGGINAEGNITRLLTGRIAQSRWYDQEGRDLLVTQFDQKKYFFDDQGIEIPEAEARHAGWSSYVVRVKIPAIEVTLPSSSSGGKTAFSQDPYLRRVTVETAGGVNADFNFDSGPRLAMRSHTTLVVRSGK